MKQIFAIVITLLSSSMLYAQDVITLKTGEAINGKVAEVGINEIKYYKSANLNGPVYVTSKADVAQITYQNGTKDVFTGTTSSPQPNAASASPNKTVVLPTAPQVVVVEKSGRRRWPYIPYPVIVPHIELGHHLDLGQQVDLGHHGSGLYDGGLYGGGHH